MDDMRLNDAESTLPQEEPAADPLLNKAADTAELPAQDIEDAPASGETSAYFAEQPAAEALCDAPVFAETEAAAAVSEHSPRDRKLRILAWILALLVTAFAVFCIVWDISRGTTSGNGYHGSGTVSVTLVQQHKPQSEGSLTDENGKYTFEGIAKAIMPSIVKIYSYEDGSLSSTGSGIVLSKEGFIATNAHVVNGSTAYRVELSGGAQAEKKFDAVLIGHDTKTDLAVLKINASGLQPAVLGDSDETSLGEAVCALGSPAGFNGSITTGIISGVNRKVRASSTNFEMDCFQTDAAISPGNSGGALVNLYGQVIGITSSKYGSGLMSGVYEGLGFAITINEALPILTELMEQGYVSGRVRVGISFLSNADAINALKQEAAAEGKEFSVPRELNGVGVRVMTIADDSDLKHTIFREGDWIIRMNSKPVDDYDTLNEALEGKRGGDSVHCHCGRIGEDGKLSTFEVDFRLLEDQSGEY